MSKPIYTCKWTWVSEWLCVLSVFVCEWERTHLLICVYEWERELTSLPPFRPITRRTNGRTDGHTRFSAETLNPKPRHTQEDTHYTEWYPDIEGYPDTEWYPLHWVIPITDTPKRIPITLSDTLTFRDTLTLSDTHYGHTQEDTHYTEWYPHPEWFFLSLTVLRTHPRVHPLHWGTLFSSQTNRTLSDTHDTEGYPWHWVIPITLSF